MFRDLKWSVFIKIDYDCEKIANQKALHSFLFSLLVEKCLTFLLQVWRNFKFPPVVNTTSPFHVITGQRNVFTLAYALPPPQSSPASAAKKDRDGGKKVEVRTKPKIVLQLRGLRFKWKSNRMTTFAQGIVWYPKEYLKWLITKPDFRIFKPSYRALQKSKGRNILQLDSYQWDLSKILESLHLIQHVNYFPKVWGNQPKC